MKTKESLFRRGGLAVALFTLSTTPAIFAADTNRPVLTIVSPASGQRITNTVAEIIVRGRARDNAHVATVQVQLNGGVWLPAASTNGFTNWTATITPQAGTNRVRAYAVDPTGNKSATNSLVFDYVVFSTLLLITNGDGGISRSFDGLVLEVGRAYTVTAVPGDGQIFAGWDGSLVATDPILHFTMLPDMNLDAHFVANPFPPTAGLYNGLYGEAVRSHAHSGFFRLSLGDHGAYTASLKRGTNVFPFSGQFNAAGVASKTVNGWVIYLALDLAGGEQITGAVSANGWIADLLAKRAVFDAITNPAAQFRGRYTLVVPGEGTSESSPAGFGYAAVTVNANGALSMAGTLADGKQWSQNVELPRDGIWACYAPLYGGQGSAWGWLVFSTNIPLQEINGTLSWIKLPHTGAVYYPLGFTNEVLAQGSRYLAPTNDTTRVIDVTNGVVVFAGGNLSAPFTNNVRLTRSNEITNKGPTRLSMSIDLANGFFSGTVKVPGISRTNTFKGALLQHLDAGFGYFLGTNQSGSVFFGETP